MISYTQMMKKRRKKRTSVRDKLIINNNREEDEVDRCRKQLSTKKKCSIQRRNGRMHQRWLEESRRVGQIRMLNLELIKPGLKITRNIEKNSQGSLERLKRLRKT